MKAYGHNCYLVASVNDQSGMGGRAVFTTSPNLTADTEFGRQTSLCPAFSLTDTSAQASSRPGHHLLARIPTTATSGITTVHRQLKYS
jgi:hypothetical protein